MATGRAKIAGETHPSVIGGSAPVSQATARSPPCPDPKHITLRSQPVEGAIPNRWRANPVIKRPYGPTYFRWTEVLHRECCNREYEYRQYSEF